MIDGEEALHAGVDCRKAAEVRGLTQSIPAMDDAIQQLDMVRQALYQESSVEHVGDITNTTFQ